MGPKIDLELLPAGDWPTHLVQEVGIAHCMFGELAKMPDASIVGAYLVAFRGEARGLFFVQHMMNARDAGKDGVEKLAIAAIMSGANEIIMVAEAWMVRAVDDNLEQVRIWLKEKGNLRDHPDAVERLGVQHHDVSGDIVTAAEIIHVDGQRELGEWSAKRQKVERGQGRFQNWFLKAQSFKGDDN